MKKKELTKAEEQIMQAVWSIEKGFAKDILEALPAPKPAYNTVLTVVRVLVDKKFLTYETFGKANRYEPTLSKDDYSLQQLQTLKKKYFNNSNKQLLSFFMKENSMDLNDLDEIVSIIKAEGDE
ncbi:BlaI/MecI/CopY family transcriptional regulator [Crocinitomix catalasitica]|uniref:BlaI/MecI/CopY family transcriptional regulator n=1 Tax=Crocinitomix catalasitica TaxID=184607 RepID=UPI000484AE3E|nr:BlaI/MecI/CopY family transcriptional regulator [Crocinitomix catalasitica]